MKKCIRCYVSGRVQGVFYRASTQDQATALGITGYAKNLSDRRVEVLACGSDHSVEELKAWLWQGPSHAQVSDVVCEPLDPKAYPTQFITG